MFYWLKSKSQLVHQQHLVKLEIHQSTLAKLAQSVKSINGTQEAWVQWPLEATTFFLVTQCWQIYQNKVQDEKPDSLAILLTDQLWNISTG